MSTSFLEKKSFSLWLFLIGLGLLAVVMKLQTLLAAKPANRGLFGFARLFSIQTQVERLLRPEPERLESSARPEWTNLLDLRKASLHKGKLVQRLKNGTSVTYSIDPPLQTRAMQLFRKYAPPYGSAVILEVRTGRILALAGASKAEPGLDPLTLALRAWAPAASVFKVVTSAALLSENRARPTTRTCYHGGDRRLAIHHLVDDPKKDLRCDTLSGALAKSINPIFGKLALKHLDRSTLLKYANRFGFNQPLDFVLPVAVSPANIPRESLARARVASGFWHVNLSPLHGALMAQALANRGEMLRPRLIASATDPKGEPLPLPAGWKRKVVTEYVSRLLGRMMVMTTTVGTAKEGFYDRTGKAYLPWARVAGKTGSLTRTEPYVDYNWFVGYAPARRPQVAMAVLIGNGPRWRVKAFHMARFLLHAYLEENINRQNRENLQRAGRQKTGRKTD